MTSDKDIRVLRDVAKQYAEAAARPIQEDRRRLWAQHNARKKTRPPVVIIYGMWNAWCREVFGDHAMKCQDPYLREHERNLRMLLFHDSLGDDFILEPWLDVVARKPRPWNAVWGVEPSWIRPEAQDGAGRMDPPIKEWADVKKLSAPPHEILEEETQRDMDRMQDAIGDIIEINLQRGPWCQDFLADISTDIAQFRGLEQIMIDMYDSPKELHALLAFVRDGVLANQLQAEQAGDWGLTDQFNWSATYAEELPRPRANVRGVPRKQLWCHCSAQEFTLISPRMHDEFMLQYQLPIIKNFGLVSYGCCEDLTSKIDMLRQIPNLRQIAVTPRADVKRCAEQIGTDYVISWRPNPADMVCCRFDESLIRRTIREGMEACKGLFVHVNLKDVETVQGDTSRLAEWVRIVREISDDY